MSTTGQGTGSFGIDEGTDFGARAARRLREDVVVWLTTVGPSGAPSPNPVWFLWDGADQVQIHSLPDAARVRHVQANPRVALHFDGDRRGGDIVVLPGRAEVRPDAPAADAVEAYVAKYGEHITRINHTPRSFAERYDTPLVITLTGLRGH
jgi:PPOX class probable F420-dependent enzyme